MNLYWYQIFASDQTVDLFMFSSHRLLILCKVSPYNTSLKWLFYRMSYIHATLWPSLHKVDMHSKTCVNGHSKKDQTLGFQDQLSLNAGQKYCKEGLLHVNY